MRFLTLFLCAALGCTHDANAPVANGPVANDEFLPSADASPARHAFEGTLVIEPGEMETLEPLAKRFVLERDIKLFPAVRLDFYTEGDRLVPGVHDLIRSGSLTTGGSFWDILVFPGQVWSEPSDGAWSRASFGFALANALENDTHHGVAAFQFNDDGIEDLHFQIVTQTAPYYVTDWFVAWGSLDARMEPDSVARAAVETPLKTRPWSELTALVGSELVDGFEAPDVILEGLIIDDTLYRSECTTPYGPLPYCDDTRFGIWSVTKTAVNSLTMLRLAEKYGPEVFDERLVDHIDPDLYDERWADVSFSEALDMATGFGEGSEQTMPNNPSDGYLDRYEEWYDVDSADEKLRAILSASKHSFGPGTVFRYRDQDMFLLGAAIDGWLKSREGRGAGIMDLVRHEIYEPIGIPHFPINRTLEPDGTEGLPLVAGGYFPTLSDLARISSLIQNGGSHDGRQILHREKLAEMMYETAARGLSDGTPGGTYHMGMWHEPYEVSPGCEIELHSMSGWGGHRVLLLPNGVTAIQISREDPNGPGAAGALGRMADVANAIRPLCP